MNIKKWWKKSMFPLVESIKIKDGEAYNLEWHQSRYERSYKEAFSSNPNWNIAETISIPEKFKTGLTKARFLYSEMEYKLEFHKYNKRKINTLKVVYNDKIDYHLKWTDRTQLQKLFS